LDKTRVLREVEPGRIARESVKVFKATKLGSLFQTRKVLRSDLEKLPLFTGEHWESELENWNKLYKVL